MQPKFTFPLSGITFRSDFLLFFPLEIVFYVEQKNVYVCLNTTIPIELFVYSWSGIWDIFTSCSMNSNFAILATSRI